MKIVISSQKNHNEQHEYLNQLWRQIEKQRIRNQTLEAELDKLIQIYQKEIIPYELKHLQPEQIRLTERLIDLFSRKSLSQRQRGKLHNWICQLLDQILLSDAPKGEQLSYDFNSTIAELNGMTLEELMETTKQHQEMIHEMEDEDIFSSQPETKEDLLDQHAEEMASSLRNKAKNAANMPNQDLFGFEDVDEIIEQAKQKFKLDASELFEDMEDIESLDWDQRLNEETVIDEKWLQTLFRRTARVLHPDRESNSDNQQIKHKAMSELLEARKNRDISSIINLYIEHVGEGKIDLDEMELEKVTRLLEQQKENLEDDFDECIHKSSMHYYVYNTLYAKTRQARAKKLKQTLRDIEELTKDTGELTRSIRNLSCLKQVLSDRYRTRETMFFEYFEDNDFDIRF